MPTKSTGRPRGRPPYPGLLTPAEERVLSLLREGHTNPEIAAAIGVSVDTVKYHVANMLSKTGLADRGELAAWRENALPERPATASQRPVLFVLAGWLRAASVPAARVVLPSGAAAVGAALVVIALVVRASYDRGPTAPPDPLTTSVATSAPTPARTVADLRRRPLTIPSLPAGSDCPLTPSRWDGNSPYAVYGEGPVYPLINEFVMRTNPGWLRARLSWIVGTEYEGPILVRGRQVDGDGTLAFAPGRRRETVVDAIAVPRSLVAIRGLEANALDYFVTNPGCYALQVDGDGLSEVVVFRTIQIKRRSGVGGYGTGGDVPVPAAVQVKVAHAPEAASVTVYPSGVMAQRWEEPLAPGPDRRYLGSLLAMGWRPDGEVVAEVERTLNPALQAVTFESVRTGTFLTRLAPGGYIGRLAWSPDGRLLALDAEAPDAAGRQVFVLDPENRRTTQLASGGGPNWAPSWSPDGTLVAFVSERDGNPEVYVMGADGSAPRRLTNNAEFDGFPTWSPDGEWILFESNRGYQRALWLMKPDGTSAHTLTSGGHSWFGSWSPDGTTIAYASDISGSYDIHTGTPSGTTRQLTSRVGSEWSPVFGPDGWLSYVSNEALRCTPPCRTGPGQQSLLWEVNIRDVASEPLRILGTDGLIQAVWPAPRKDNYVPTAQPHPR